MPDRPRRTFVAKKGSSVTCTQWQEKGTSLSSMTVFTQDDLPWWKTGLACCTSYFLKVSTVSRSPCCQVYVQTTVKCSGCLCRSSPRLPFKHIRTTGIFQSGYSKNQPLSFSLLSDSDIENPFRPGSNYDWCVWSWMAPVLDR
jgi:hypothetical protein